METYVKNTYYREVRESIKQLVKKDGKFDFGTFNSTIPNVNMHEAYRPLGYLAPKWFENYRLKEWEAFQAGNEDVFILGAVYNVKVSVLLYLIVYDKRYDKLYEYSEIVNPSKAAVGKGLLDSETKGESKNIYIQYINKLKDGVIRINAHMKHKGKLPEIKLELKAYHITEPIVICQPFGENRGLYSHKNFMPAEGNIFIGDERIDFDKSSSHMIIDDHKGYYPYNMKYDWVTGWGKDESGNDFAFNLTDNQVLDHEKYNENCIWYNGKMNVLPPIKVQRENNSKEIWKIKDKHDMVNLTFHIAKKTKIKFNCLVVASDYEAPFGRYEGYLKAKDKLIHINTCFGMGEKKRIRI
ncbi:DUF2804 family protein [Anaerosalibacter sp. Marseille-P3206]|uniref:DUF2804 family protein n=1 Tax=Anaerosalibacter sp. Marseille-P3206 TaxID=1871005 RepID=UPI00098623B9|nr:DUF2804 family protein [Anaerosalibacter sp. Marseille-P3206]